MKDLTTIVFGPVPSRRLGQSLGINNIPPKYCSYSCVYCQVGKTTDITTTRKSFYVPETILEQVKKKVNEASTKGLRVDYLSFVPDGEPTLDINLGKELSLLKQMGIPKAVITNSSMMWLENVKEDLLEADFISLKIDAVSKYLWKKVDRPQKGLELNTILEGIMEFSKKFKGTLVSETMLIDGINYSDEFEKIADFLKHLKKLDRAYVAIPTRPPVEKWVKPADEQVVNTAVQTFSKNLGANRVECLIGYEGNAFACTGNVRDDLLGITAVHPMRRDAVTDFLKKTDSGWSIIEKLLQEGKLIELEYHGEVYYMRRLPRRTETNNVHT